MAVFSFCSRPPGPCWWHGGGLAKRPDGFRRRIPHLGVRAGKSHLINGLLEHLGEASSLAGRALDSALGTGGLGTLYALYRDRIEHFLTAPPPAEWDGVYIATSK